MPLNDGRWHQLAMTYSVELSDMIVDAIQTISSGFSGMPSPFLCLIATHLTRYLQAIHSISK